MARSCVFSLKHGSQLNAYILCSMAHYSTLASFVTWLTTQRLHPLSRTEQRVKTLAWNLLTNFIADQVLTRNSAVVYSAHSSACTSASPSSPLLKSSSMPSPTYTRAFTSSSKSSRPVPLSASGPCSSSILSSYSTGLVSH